MLVTPLASPPDARVRVPGSKSHTNRALICAALASGTSTLDGALFADDTEAMLSAIERLGATVRADEAASIIEVDGFAGSLPDGEVHLDVRQSGTTGRFVLPVLGLGSGRYVLDGDPQLRARPFGDLVDALEHLGVRTEGRGLPIVVHGGHLRGGEIDVAGDVSSQFLSGLLLSAPCASGAIAIRVSSPLVSVPYIDLTLATMRSFGASVDAVGHERFVVAPTGYRAADVTIEPDASAASYFFGAAVMTGGRVRVDRLGRDAIQGDLAFVDVLEQMGARVTRGIDFTEVAAGDALHGVDVDLRDFSDTAQTLAVVASAASSPTRITGIGFIRKKETDRIAAVVTELNRRGILAIEEEDGVIVHPGRPTPGVVDTYDDHRMAMSFALLGLVDPGIELSDPDCVNKTFPGYFAALDQLR